MSTSFLLFITSSWILILSPGPDSLYVLTRSISLGKKAGIISAIGVTLGILVHTTFAALGISAILMTSSTLFYIIKIIGTVYLVYIGIKTILDKKKITINSKSIQGNTTSLFWQGVLSDTLNPKIALFFLSYLPQFIDKDSGSTSIQILLLGSLFALFGGVYLVILGYFSGKIGNWITTREGIMNKIRIISGSILIALGIRLAFTERN